MNNRSWMRLAAFAALLAASCACKKSKDEGAGGGPTGPAVSTTGGTTTPGAAGGASGATAEVPTAPDSTRLPPAATPTAATPDQAAAELARAVLAGGDGALPALLDVKIEFEDGAGRLERTKSNSSDGKQLQVKATVKLNAGGLRYFNCFRIMLNAIGVDFNVGNDGDVAALSAMEFAFPLPDEVTPDHVSRTIQVAGKPAAVEWSKDGGRAEARTLVADKFSVLVVVRPTSGVEPVQALLQALDLAALARIP